MKGVELIIKVIKILPFIVAVITICISILDMMRKKSNDVSGVLNIGFTMLACMIYGCNVLLLSKEVNETVGIMLFDLINKSLATTFWIIISLIFSFSIMIKDSIDRRKWLCLFVGIILPMLTLIEVIVR